ncbi:MAG: PIG-L deacetylase family protein [Candidatus Brocadiia bacterium]
MDISSTDAFMAIGAHCDDVDLRMGGTFSRLVGEGKRGCYVVAVENAYVGDHYTVESSREALNTRRKESTRASQILGADRLEWLTFKSYYFSTPEPGSVIYPSFDSPESVQEELRDAIFEGLPPLANAQCFARCRRRLRKLIEEFAPDVIFTHSPDDRHCDHYGIARFVDYMIGGMEAEGTAPEVLFWEPGSGGPIAGYHPDFFVEISEEDVRTKQKAIESYGSQFAEGVLDEFAAGRAQAWGEMAGVQYAEPFRHRCREKNDWDGRSKMFDVVQHDQAPEKEVYDLP